MAPRILSAIVGSCTNRRADTERHAILLRAFHDFPEVRAAILDGRARWQEWLTVTQRKWQASTRRQSRARHHDSVAIRERYVRCEA